MYMRTWLSAIAVLVVVATASCSNNTEIKPDPSGSSGNSSSTQGAGGNGSGVTKIVSAETDMGQYVVSGPLTLPGQGSIKLAEGPLFLTDLFGQSYIEVYLVNGTDCSAQPQTRVAGTVQVANTSTGFPWQLHGVRFPVPMGQSLCSQAGGGSSGFSFSFAGFRPY